MKRALLLLLLGGCVDASTPMAYQSTAVGKFTYLAPADWKHVDRVEPRRDRIEWSPDNNLQKEMITVIRSEISPALLAAGTPALEGLLMKAQQELPGAKLGQPITSVTTEGLKFVEVQGDFLPAGRTQRYTRIHAIVVGKEAIVHVLYTALDPDRRAFELVINSIRSGEG